MTFDANDLIELYAAPTQLEADRLVLLLDEDGIEAIARATTMSSFPTTGTWLVQVKGSDVDQARKLIAAARSEGAVTMGGDFVGG